MTSLLRSFVAMLGVLGVLTFMVAEADAARAGRSGSAGSRGSRTYTPPPATSTAPSTARPIERSATPNTAQPGTRAAAPAAAPAPARPGLFNRPGFLGGLAAGMLGAGLLGMLFGNGLMGGLGGIASILGLLIQIGIIAGVGYMLYRWWQRRSQPSPAYAGGPAPSHAYEPPAETAPVAPKPMFNASSGPGYGAAAYGQPQANSQPVDEIGIQPADYDAFEQSLIAVQTAYSKEDLATLRTRATPEMLGYLQEEIAENTKRGTRAQLSDVKLLQGDLSEAWREDGVEYATVALRYELIDALVNRTTGQVVEGDDKNPTEALELWTFARPRAGSPWMLSAIQQVEDEPA